jgi:hypothetical protein
MSAEAHAGAGGCSSRAASGATLLHQALAHPLQILVLQGRWLRGSPRLPSRWRVHTLVSSDEDG